MSTTLSALTPQQIEAQVIHIICENLDVKTTPEQLTREKKFVEDLGVDSITIVEIMMGLEDAFGLRIRNMDYGKIKTVGGTVEYVLQLLKN